MRFVLVLWSLPIYCSALRLVDEDARVEAADTLALETKVQIGSDAAALAPPTAAPPCQGGTGLESVQAALNSTMLNAEGLTKSLQAAVAVQTQSAALAAAEAIQGKQLQDAACAIRASGEKAKAAVQAAQSFAKSPTAAYVAKALPKPSKEAVAAQKMAEATLSKARRESERLNSGAMAAKMQVDAEKVAAKAASAAVKKAAEAAKATKEAGQAIEYLAGTKATLLELAREQEEEQYKADTEERRQEEKNLQEMYYKQLKATEDREEEELEQKEQADRQAKAKQVREMQAQMEKQRRDTQWQAQQQRLSKLKADIEDAKEKEAADAQQTLQLEKQRQEEEEQKKFRDEAQSKAFQKKRHDAIELSDKIITQQVEAEFAQKSALDKVNEAEQTAIRQGQEEFLQQRAQAAIECAKAQAAAKQAVAACTKQKAIRDAQMAAIMGVRQREAASVMNQGIAAAMAQNRMYALQRAALNPYSNPSLLTAGTAQMYAAQSQLQAMQNMQQQAQMKQLMAAQAAANVNAFQNQMFGAQQQVFNNQRAAVNMATNAQLAAAAPMNFAKAPVSPQGSGRRDQSKPKPPPGPKANRKAAGSACGKGRGPGGKVNSAIESAAKQTVGGEQGEQAGGEEGEGAAASQDGQAQAASSAPKAAEGAATAGAKGGADANRGNETVLDKEKNQRQADAHDAASAALARAAELAFGKDALAEATNGNTTAFQLNDETLQKLGLRQPKEPEKPEVKNTTGSLMGGDIDPEKDPELQRKLKEVSETPVLDDSFMNNIMNMNGSDILKTLKDITPV
eukprot:TRINITY_DN7080_c0_g1_i1.p1 TRINITY_DN7080_c0_g1~~TRINITY_DN7080_c0_g1_i1.p1  ORF type:complete len:796 (-),score=326.29 TRINITY_DN7080_c0_g1_i1:69-2456(-)